jgi:hypothetical protein
MMVIIHKKLYFLPKYELEQQIEKNKQRENLKS